MDSAPKPNPVRSRHARWLYFAVAWVFVGIGALGAVLPLMPTTPFLLLALWSFSRSSERFHHWLYTHRVFGPVLQNWHGHRVVPRSVRVVAYTSMAASTAYTAYRSASGNFHWAIPTITAIACAVGVYFISRCPLEPPHAVSHDDTR